MSALSKGGKTWLTKLGRISEISKGNKECVFNNLGHIIDFDMLLDGFHALDGKKAVGIDKLTKEEFGQDLTANLSEILVSLRRNTYAPQASRTVEIPKEDGSKRPLAISCVGDKIVQWCFARILEAIFEPLFLDCSYGYRPNRSAHAALGTLVQTQGSCLNGAVVEVDLKSYFNSVPHLPLLDFLQKKINDRRFLGNLVKLMKAPVQNTDGKIATPKMGVPQGSILSPVLSNIYLHYVLDLWFAELRTTTFKYNCFQVRFADDVAWVFASKPEAQRFYNTLPKRLAKYGLTLNFEKSSILPSGKYAIERMIAKGDAMPQFKFVGFQLQWMRGRNGQFRPRVRPRKDRMNATLKRVGEYLRKNRTHPNHMNVLKAVSLVYQGWLRYFAVSDCQSDMWNFRHRIRIMLHRWFNRRGKRGCMNWQRLDRILEQNKLSRMPKLFSLWSCPKVEWRQNSGA